LCAHRDDPQLERAPSDHLDDVQHGGDVGEPRAEQPAQQHHRGLAGLRSRHRGEADHRGADQAADEGRDQRRGEGERVFVEQWIDQEQREGEPEQADAQIGPERALIERAEGLGGCLIEGERGLGRTVINDGRRH
jgi:hypothetical protein